jgi:hypothetical protein
LTLISNGTGFNNSSARGLLTTRSLRSILSSFKTTLFLCEQAEDIIAGIIRVIKANEMNNCLFIIPDFNQK